MSAQVGERRGIVSAASALLAPQTAAKLRPVETISANALAGQGRRLEGSVARNNGPLRDIPKLKQLGHRFDRRRGEPTVRLLSENRPCWIWTCPTGRFAGLTHLQD
jgi:hypothetical protein